MYQNIYYQRNTNTIHIWDDVKGYFTMPYQRYAFKPAVNGEWTSIYGDKLTKVFKYEKDDSSLFESDVPEITRVLVDLYTNSDLPSDGHKILTFDIEVEMNSGLPDTEKAENEITSIAVHDSVEDYYYVLILDKNRTIQPSKSGNRLVAPFDTEKEMLSKFLDIYESISPTIITGWNIDFFDVPYLFNRLKNLLGERQAKRLSPIREVFFSPYRKKWFIGGVSALDYLVLYKEYNYTELDNYRLDTVAKIELGRGKVEYTGNLDELFEKDKEKFIEYNLEDVRLIVDMDKKLQFIDLCRGIAHAGHVAYEDVFFTSRPLEGALLCFLRQRGLVAPNKMKKEDSDRMIDSMRETGGIDESAKDEKFIGAYVKDPIVGKYDWVYDLDLTSLYPSIIMTLNISPETKMGKVDNWDIQRYLKGLDDFYSIQGKQISKEKFKDFLKDSGYSIASNGVIYRNDKIGCIPAILDEWFQKRVEFRKLEKQFGEAGDKEKYAFYKKRQLVQKILLNSLYGVLGLPSFRFYDIDNAEAVTITGQTVIKSTADMTNIKYNKELGTQNADYNIYIDTDSVFFSAVPLLDHRHPNWKQMSDAEVAKLVDGIAGETQDYLNNFYNMLSEKMINVPKDKHRFQIKKEFVARAGLWIAKKRYAQWIIAENGVPVDRLDVKGLDVVRSSFPQSFKDFMKQTLIDILRGETKETMDEKIINFKGSLPLVKPYNIAKSSSVKELSKYTPAKGAMFQFLKGTPAHVKAAWTYNQLLKHFNCGFKYSPMRNGDKMKWVYLKQNPLGLDTIAFKGADDPEEIESFIKNYIDYDKIFESEMQNKLEDFYRALSWGNLQLKITKSDKFFSF
jgi:DNA polymerase elongation subunit (family B)